MQPLKIDQTAEPDNSRSQYVGCTRRHLKYRVNTTALNKLGNATD